VHGINQAAVANAGLLFYLAQRVAVEIMLHRHIGQQLIAIQALGKHARRSGADKLLAFGTMFAFQVINYLLHPDRLTIHYCPGPVPLSSRIAPQSGQVLSMRILSTLSASSSQMLVLP